MTEPDENDFPILSELDFFNHAGVAPISGPAARALEAYAEQAAGRAYVDAGWYRRIAEVKGLAAELIKAAGKEEIAFIPNTSSGLALVAGGVDWRRGDDVVITSVEYPANRYPWMDLQRHGVRVIEVDPLPDGRVDPEDVCEAITDRTRVVSLSHVQYASGHRIDLRPIADTVHHAGGWLCVDGIQSVGVLPVNVAADGVDFLAADGHKWMLGPEGCGFFYCREDLVRELHPAVVGWMNMVDAHDYGDYRFEFQNDARRFEPGSYNVPGILALGASLELLLDTGIETIWSKVEALNEQLAAGLAERGYHVFSPRERPEERSGIVVFEPRSGVETGQVLEAARRQRVVIVRREGRLRASPHFYNRPEQIDHLLESLP